MKNVLFYGDSNTWGFNPETSGRYPVEKRWTTICAGLLGAGYHCVAAGMNGRMTCFDDPLKACRNGCTGLDYELQTHKPLDVMVIMLGTNDLKYTDAQGSSEGMRKLLDLVLSANERFSLSSPVFTPEAGILLISPVLVTGSLNQDRACDEKAQSRRFCELYGEIAREKGIGFLDAAAIAAPSDADGVHLGECGHDAIGKAAASAILNL